MFKVTGEIINLFDSPANEKYEASFKVQLLGEHRLPDGQIKKEMLTLGVPRTVYDSLQGKVGQSVTLPVGMFVKAGQLNVYFPKASISGGSPSA
jgi:hypothetical protein